MRQQVSTGKPTQSRFRFIGEIISELKKVVWPSRGEAFYLTRVVIIVSCAVGIVLGLIDWAFSKFFEQVILPPLG